MQVLGLDLLPGRLEHQLLGGLTAKVARTPLSAWVHKGALVCMAADLPVLLVSAAGDYVLVYI